MKIEREEKKGNGVKELKNEKEEGVEKRKKKHFRDIVLFRKINGEKKLLQIKNTDINREPKKARFMKIK